MNNEYGPVIRDRIRGSIIGGAAGDALGYPVEFMSRSSILSQYGGDGITGYALTRGKALFSDDTQMTLFTANGLLNAAAQGAETDPKAYETAVYRSYLDWLYTQRSTDRPPRVSRLLDVQELHALRAPGNTCLSALMSGRMGTVDEPLNHSKGCGGVMRVAPVGLMKRFDAEAAFDLSCGCAVITHGHPLGWLPAGILAYIVHRLVFNGESMTAAAEQALIYMRERYLREESAQLDALIREAISLTENDLSDADNIRKLGEGWVGDEALAIVLYAAIKYEHDFDRALICAVNHSGDSDSTGAIAGNLVGAVCGCGSIADKWKDDLELYDVLLSIADDLSDDLSDPARRQKYLRG